MVRQLIKSGIWLSVVALGIFAYTRFFITEPCDSPIQYTIGAFDTRFGISQKDFLATIDQAANIWEASIDKNILEYNPKGKLIINLIYDDRQKTTQNNQILKTDIAKINELATSVKERYLALLSEYGKEEEAYGAMLGQFKEHQDAYTTQVRYWNTHGGAPKDEYRKLDEEKEKLTTEYATIDKKRIEINTLADKINSFIHTYNLLITDANTTIDTINLSAGREFQEGVYDPSRNEIDIYEFSTEDKLLRVITHEMGHALGIPHNTNPESIMYELNQADTSVLSKDDLDALKTQCSIASE